MGHRPLRLLLSFAGVAIVTFVAYRVVAVNATTVGFAYLLLVLVIASVWGFLEAAFASVLATLVFNFFFFPPIGTFTIADPQNWVALFAFFTTALTASQLSARLKRQRKEAQDRQREMERLYVLSRAILLTDATQPTAKQIAHQSPMPLSVLQWHFTIAARMKSIWLAQKLFRTLMLSFASPQFDPA